MRDHKNPDYMFQTIDTELLVKAANGEIDVMERIRKELACRGLGRNGEWIGFDKAKELWSKKKS